MKNIAHAKMHSFYAPKLYNSWIASLRYTRYWIDIVFRKVIKQYDRRKRSLIISRL